MQTVQIVDPIGTEIVCGHIDNGRIAEREQRRRPLGRWCLPFRPENSCVGSGPEFFGRGGLIRVECVEEVDYQENVEEFERYRVRHTY